VDLLWSLLAIGFVVGYFLVLFRAVLDVFRSDDLNGWAKAGWFVALLVVPVVPLLLYLVLRGRGITALARAKYLHLRDDAGAVSA